MSNKEKIENLKREVEAIKNKIAQLRNQDNGTCCMVFIFWIFFREKNALLKFLSPIFYLRWDFVIVIAGFLSFNYGWHGFTLPFV